MAGRWVLGTDEVAVGRAGARDTGAREPREELLRGILAAVMCAGDGGL